MFDKKKLKYKVKDYVRISKNRETFSKGYTANSTSYMFKVIQAVQTNPTTYRLQDFEGKIKGLFYLDDLQKVKYPDWKKY